MVREAQKRARRRRAATVAFPPPIASSEEGAASVASGVGRRRESEARGPRRGAIARGRQPTDAKRPQCPHPVSLVVWIQVVQGDVTDGLLDILTLVHHGSTVDLVVVLLQVHKRAYERLIQLLKGALSHVCKGLVSAVIRDTVEHSDIVWFRLRRGVIADQEAACHEMLR